MKPFRIISLEAHQIGPFGDFKMTFPEKPVGMEDKAEVHILTGENGVGKSTILEMISNSIVLGNMNLFFKKVRKDDIVFSKVNFSHDGLTILEKKNGELIGDSDNKFLDYYRTNIHRDAPLVKFSAFAYSSYRRIEQVEIDSLFQLPIKPLEFSLDFQKSVENKQILHWIASTITKELLAKNESDFVAAAKFRKAISTIEETVSNIVNYPIRFHLEYDPLKISIQVNHERLDFNLLPDGLKSIISWLADLLMRMDRVKWVNDTPVFKRNFILFLDEIEVHMHPKWQRKILPAVQSLFPNAQIFISTHSPFVINSVDGAWIHRLVKPNGDSVAEAPILSEDGKSVTHILEEIFGIKERFGDSVEQDLKTFYELRNEVLKGGDDTDLLNIAKKLQGQSTELDQVVEMEIRQINRRRKLQPNN